MLYEVQQASAFLFIKMRIRWRKPTCIRILFFHKMRIRCRRQRASAFFSSRKKLAAFSFPFQKSSASARNAAL